MKVILTGSTGFIGKEVLEQCRADKEITSIIALTRRSLGDEAEKDPKVQVIIMKDFKVYPKEVVKQLEGADACIWSMGHISAIPEVEIDYPLAFAKAFAPTLRKPFRYMHCSGILAERDQTKRLWFLQEGRRTKGAAEREMIAVEARTEVHEGHWSTFIVKPSMVLEQSACVFPKLLGGVIGAVQVNELAAAMIDIVRRGSEEQVSHNAMIVMRGRAVLDTARQIENIERNIERL
ncbi:hypothetical protein LSUE1_G001182 [Lachnellula suecica]|uniref:NAD(P)-binding domain-containing protein n=1 Tax=Lachnellula suecica TaxID=602035 RepID=A0A8T9CDI4_9HELO|nr:hypothetical protein LSUE1_G001182 [Lachnellula suecica]